MIPSVKGNPNFHGASSQCLLCLSVSVITDKHGPLQHTRTRSETVAPGACVNCRGCRVTNSAKSMAFVFAIQHSARTPLIRLSTDMNTLGPS